ncbi:hypothetical protein P171DRAFT_70319 [Karstenula rhodostoma CBS 690.94]|uniref:Uncharacterized protein n=1 Tax=Karstenula rhodostoma CBS 690.94 TaxID=1392251 RepID=A0A9P4PGQ9_9PLEO|nr:hypothetical protein P171DRAFT_70319 [Karstenula rhodostoma CBS 690.94]
MTTTADHPWAGDLAVAALWSSWRQPSTAACARAETPERVASTPQGSCSSPRETCIRTTANSHQELPRDPHTGILCCVGAISCCEVLVSMGTHITISLPHAIAETRQSLSAWRNEMIRSRQVNSYVIGFLSCLNSCCYILRPSKACLCTYGHTMNT